MVSRVGWRDLLSTVVLEERGLIVCVGGASEGEARFSPGETGGERERALLLPACVFAF